MRESRIYMNQKFVYCTIINPKANKRFVYIAILAKKQSFVNAP
jgi:hypothetical protein